jgi:D-serine deaminase-like pyridoxal phosphate-dependent protein
MILDLDRVDQNLDAISASIRPPKRYRIVAKSLPSIPLLDYAMKRTGSSRLMAFHQPALSAIARSLPRSEVLLGKPLPVAAARRFYHSLGSSSFDPDLQVQWLIDSRDRLLQYQQLARELGRQFRINVEIDVGDHRGNVRDTEMLDGILREIAGDPDHSSFAGFMGYDAYIAGFTPAWRRRLLADVLDRYQEFVDFVRERHPSLFHDRLTFNGAGSQTFRLYEDDHVLNDLAAGSGVVKPADFDMDLLDQHQPALFIATPILKRRDRLEIPVAGWLGSLMTSWNPNRQQAFFIYGGFWKAHFESPGGLVTNPIYGRSSNSEMVNASDRVPISVDDHVFLRPTQSEDVMLQFGNLLCVRQGAIVDEWPPLREDPIGFAQDTPAS